MIRHILVEPPLFAMLVRDPFGHHLIPSVRDDLPIPPIHQVRPLCPCHLEPWILAVLDAADRHRGPRSVLVSYNDQTVILKNLKKGERVVVKGFSQITDGTEINIVKEKSGKKTKK